MESEVGVIIGDGNRSRKQTGATTLSDHTSNHTSDHVNILGFTYNEISSKNTRRNCKILIYIDKYYV
jgi:hypothetical protein